jgi:small subunit ribosomal protein S20
MPITKSAKKALRSSKRKRVFNLRKKDVLLKTIKQVKKLVATGKAKEAKAMMPKVQKIIDKSVKTGVLKGNTGARKKSRISAMIKNLG